MVQGGQGFQVCGSAAEAVPQAESRVTLYSKVTRMVGENTRFSHPPTHCAKIPQGSPCVKLSWVLVNTTSTLRAESQVQRAAVGGMPRLRRLHSNDGSPTSHQPTASSNRPRITATPPRQYGVRREPASPGASLRKGLGRALLREVRSRLATGTRARAWVENKGQAGITSLHAWFIPATFRA